MREYLHYIGPALKTWALGIGWLWTRQGDGITYKPGWGPLWPRPFLLVYLTTYLAGTIAGYGVVSLSRAWWERSLVIREHHVANGGGMFTVTYRGAAHPFARFMTRLLDWAFHGSAHGRHTGPRLWGVEGIR